MKLEYYKWYRGDEILPEQMEDFCTKGFDENYEELDPYFLVIQNSEPASAVRISENGGKNWRWEYCYGGPSIVRAAIAEAFGIDSSKKEDKNTLYWMAFREPQK